MKTPFRLWSALVLCGLLLFGGLAGAAESGKSSAKSTPGLEAAQAISTITGVAISPLLGVSGVGVWKYFKTAPEHRAKLSWYAQPWFWIPALLLVAVAFVKDTFGTVLPTAVKKPFDIAEAVENKVSGLVAAGAFVPLIAAIFGSLGGDDSALYGDAGLAIINVAPLLNILTIPFAIAAFVVREIVLAIAVQRMADQLAAAGELPTDDLPRSAAGRSQSARTCHRRRCTDYASSQCAVAACAQGG